MSPTTFIDTVLGTLKGVSDRLTERIGLVDQQRQADVARLEARIESLLQARAVEQSAREAQWDAVLLRLATLEARGPARDGRDGAPGERGPQGDPGPVGPRGERGMPGEAGRDGLRGEMGPAGPAGEKGLDGARGEMGPVGPVGPRGEKGLDGARGEMGPVGPVGPAGPAGERGADGDVGPMGPPGPAGRDGRDGLPGPAGEKGLDGRPGQDGRDGVDGRDGQDGLGLEDLDFTLDLETKHFGVRAARGERVVERQWFLPVVIYRGIWELGREYLAGDQVTSAGSQWTAKQTTRERPGEDSRAWVLSAKRGRDGKPGPPGPKGDG